MRILGIETTCDDTGISIYDASKHKVIYNKVITQSHSEYGGVHVGIAPREHLKKLYSTFQNDRLQLQNISLIAYAASPGLIPCLAIGSSFARGLSLSTGISCLGVNHLDGHLVSPWLTQKEPDVPYLALLLTGGHTQLFYITGKENILLGQTLDDALGELFDKVARMLGLGYPGGPLIEQNALKSHYLYDFPLPMCKEKNLDFSFSGLKSHIRRFCENLDDITPMKIYDVSSSLQHTVLKTLITKLAWAIQDYPEVKAVSLIGGVSANKFLRSGIKDYLNSLKMTLYCADLEYCTDNAAMIAYAGYRMFKNK